jgi:uncharacterized protein (DUF427 family)
MPEPIAIAPAPGTWVVRAAGAVLGESRRALHLAEAGHAPVLYFPRADIAMALLDRTAKRTTCPWKGEATHYSIQTGTETLENAAWSYEDPTPGKEAIAGHIAFYPDRVTVEKI